MVNIKGKSYNTFKGNGSKKEQSSPNRNREAIDNYNRTGSKSNSGIQEPIKNREAIQQTKPVEVTRTVVTEPQPFLTPGQTQTETLNSTKVEETQEPQPVASYQEGINIYRSQEGQLFIPAASYGNQTEQGEILTALPPPRIKLSRQELPGAGSGFLTPGIAISEERRRNIIELGENLVENADKPGILGVQRSQLGQKLRTIVGSNLQRLGYNPQDYTVKQVVLPSTTGALIGTGTTYIFKATPKALETLGFSKVAASRGTKIIESGATVAGLGALTAQVVTRKPSEQSPDIIFGTLGAIKGAKPYDITTKQGQQTPVYSEPYIPGQRSQRTRTANKPTSKAQLTKQSLNQAYNPNIYRTPTATIERTPRSARSLEILQGGIIRATEAKIYKTGEGTLIAAKTAYINPKNSPRINEPNRIVAMIPKGAAITPKASAAYKRPPSQVKTNFGNPIQENILVTQTTKQTQITKNPSRQPSFKPEPFKPNNQPTTNLIPQYELTPNAKTYAQLPKGISARGGFRYRKTGEPVIRINPFTQQQPDIALNRELITTNKILPTQQQKTTINPQTKTELRTTPQIKNNLLERQKLTPQDALRFLPKQVPTVESLTLQKPYQLTGIAAAQSQRTESKQKQSPATIQIPIQITTSLPDQKTQDQTINTPKQPINNQPNQRTQQQPIPRIKKPARTTIQKIAKTNTEETQAFPTKIDTDYKPKKRKGFNVLVRTKGQFKKINAQALSKEQAINLGVIKVKNTAAASLKITPSNTEASNTQFPKQNLKDFYISRKEKNVLIQKTINRITTPGEKKEIPYKSKQINFAKNNPIAKIIKRR